jgi:hypothetical protein
MTETRKTRLQKALGGAVLSPFVAGLTFSSPEVLASVVPGCDGYDECLLEVAEALHLDFVFVNAAAPWAVALAQRATCGVMWVVDGPLWPVLDGAASVSAGLKRTVRDSASLAEDLDREVARATMRCQQGLELDVDAIVVAEDLAGNDGLLVTTEFADEMLVPRLAKLAVVARGRAPVLLHSDGDIRALLPALQAAGFSAVHAGGGLDREGFEQLFWEARRCGLAVVGGVQTRSLAGGTYAAVRAGTRAALLAQSGGLLISDDGGISTAEEIAAYASAVAAARGTGY